MISIRLIAIGIGYIAGIICATFLQLNTSLFKILFWGVSLLSTLILLWTLYREYNWKENHFLLRFCPVLLAAFCLANLITNNFLFSSNPAVLFFNGLSDKSRVELRGIIASEPETRSDTRLDLRLRIKEFKKDRTWCSIDSPVDIKVSVNYPNSDTEKEIIVAKIADLDAYGYFVELSGLYQRSSRPLNPGGFDYESFLMSEGYVASIKLFSKDSQKEDYIKILQESKGNFFIEAALIAKKSFLSTIQQTIPPPESFFVSGAVLGTRFSIKKQEYRGKFVEDFFRHSGVGHVLAVSGLHVSVVSLLLFSLFRITRINPKYFTPFLVILLFLFAFLTGARPSSLRATIMNSLVIIFYVYGGGGLTQSAYTGLAFSSFLILLRRPMALYSPGFLLSFGAVFSLVTLTNPFDKILRTLRGGKFFAGVVFFLLCIYLICTKWEFFLKIETISALIALFCLLLYFGGKLNEIFPKIIVVNPDKLPSSLRIFFAAQIAIQFGMMIPLSSFFFGQFPVAGIFVNLLAIPLIGVIVQLGLLGGILGAIPVIGTQLALVIGAANYVFAKFFIWVAYIGSEIFPFPVTPIPGLRRLIIYYILLAIFASSGLWIRKVQNLSFILYKRFPVIQSVVLPILIIIILLFTSIYRYKILPDKNAELNLLANTSYPVVCITQSDHRRGAILIGGGDIFFAQSSLKSFLLSKKNIYIEDAFLLGHSPEFGISALIELSSVFRVDRVYFPNFYALPKDTLPSFSSMKDYFNAIGEDRIYSSAMEGKLWAKNYYESFVKFTNTVSAKVKTFSPPNSFKLSDGIEIEYPVKVYRSYPFPLIIKFQNKKVLIIPDTGAIDKIPEEKLNAEIVILSGPTKTNYKYYLKSIRTFFNHVSPKIVLYSVNTSLADEKILEIIEESSEILAKGTEKFIRTDKSGTVTLSINGNIISEKVKTHIKYEY